MCFNNNSLSEVHDHMALYIHMPQGFPRTRFLISVVDGWISWSRQDLRARFAGKFAQGYTTKIHALYDLTPNGI